MRLRISSDDVRNHSLRLCLGLGREIALRVDLADGVAEQAVHHKHSALPAGTLLRRAGKCLAEKCEAFIRQRFRKHSRIGLDQVERQPVLPRVERSGGHQSGLAGKGLGLPDNEAGLLADPRPVKVLGPVQSGRFGRKVSLGPRVVGLVNVLVVRQAAMGLCNGVLEFNNAGGTGVCVRESGES